MLLSEGQHFNDLRTPYGVTSLKGPTLSRITVVRTMLPTHRLGEHTYTLPSCRQYSEDLCVVNVAVLCLILKCQAWGQCYGRDQITEHLGMSTI